MLLTFASDSDKHKFEYIYEKYKRLLLAKAYDILKDRSLAEDAVSETFIRAYKHFHKIDDPDSGQAAAYLVTIARNIAITMYHREKRTTPIDLSEYDTPDDLNLEEMVATQDEAATAWQLVDQLKEEYKSVFLLKYAHDMSHKTIAKLLGTTENNVTVRLHRAKAKLLQLIQRLEVQSGK